MTSVAPTSREVRIGSILFTDLVGFTEYTDVVGDVAALHVLDEQTDLVGALIGPFDGARIVKELGDGLMIWFESAADGVEYAIASMAAINAARNRGTFPLAVRMGMHHGEAIARGDDLVGQTVNIAARVSDAAGPGELLISEEVLSALGESPMPVDLRPIGPVVLKGVHEPIWLYRLAV